MGKQIEFTIWFSVKKGVKLDFVDLKSVSMVNALISFQEERPYPSPLYNPYRAKNEV